MAIEWDKSELDIINKCLIAIGETPYPDNTLIDDFTIGVDAEIAKRIVRDTLVEVSSRGWFFNTDYDFKLIPDENGFISLPDIVLRVDFGNNSSKHKYTVKNNRVYDYVNHTFIITEEVYGDIVWLPEFSDLPSEAYIYVASRAANKFQAKIPGAIETDQFLKREEIEAYTNLQRLEMQSKDYNLQNKKVSTRTHNGYLYNSLYGIKGR